MTNDIVQRLLLNVPCWSHETAKKGRRPCGQDTSFCEECRKKQDAADLIEAQAAEIERLKAEFSVAEHRYLQDGSNLTVRAEAAEAKLERLRRRLG